MNHLIIYTHFNSDSFSKAIVTEIEKILKERGEVFKTIDLYADKFNPVFDEKDLGYMYGGEEAPEDIKKYQDLVSWADELTFVYPLWWGQMPAMLKGFIDRVFSNGFAFTYDESGAEGLFKDKSAKAFINTGAPYDYYKELGMHKSIKQVTDEAIFDFCGMKSETIFFGNVAFGTNDERKIYLESLQNYY
ncbi:NAD(P)H-dependent oxidoreductase [Aureivirga marina]|uniref:NAD(P)H-dependent oxidoreductase n=1 Tax=Aureivirga marina TaxID=1182451 RepID=UPI0018CB4ACB|nr:NAD(P)H-dependent oxidoreductase [Aureivirga marina]